MSIKQRPRIADFVKQQAVLLYQSGMAPRLIEERLPISRTSVREAVVTSGILRRTPSEGRRVYSVDHDYFKQIDSPSKAYLLGFIAADGCVFKNTVTISLSSTDRHHLEKISSAVAFTGKIHDSHYIYDLPQGVPVAGPKSLISITSPQMVKDLDSHGIRPRKSLVLEAWEGSAELLRFYYAGLVDGDGWIYRAKSGQWVVGLGSTLSVVSGFKRFVFDATGHEMTVRKQGSIYVTKCQCARMCQNIAQLLWCDQPISLDRKRELATTLLAENVKENARLITFNGETRRLFEWAKMLKISHSVILHRLESGWSVDKALGTPAARTNEIAPAILNIFKDNKGTIISTAELARMANVSNDQARIAVHRLIHVHRLVERVEPGRFRLKD